MRNSRAAFLILICLLSAGLVAACGDDDDSGGETSAEEFIAEADNLCTESAREALRNPEPTPTNAEEAAESLEESLKEREEAIADFEALGDPPAEIAKEWQQLNELRQQRLAKTRELLKLARQGIEAENPRYASVIEESSKLGDQGDAIYAEIGSTACAGILPPDERKEVIKFVTFWETKPFPGECEKYTTLDGINLLFGSVKKCEEAQLTPPPEGYTKRVKVTSVEGIAGVNATVDASLFGGVGDGSKVTYNLVFEDGQYKVDSASLQAGLTS
jgi:hypothetical protein